MVEGDNWPVAYGERHVSIRHTDWRFKWDRRGCVTSSSWPAVHRRYWWSCGGTVCCIAVPIAGSEAPFLVTENTKSTRTPATPHRDHAKPRRSVADSGKRVSGMDRPVAHTATLGRMLQGPPSSWMCACCDVTTVIDIPNNNTFCCLGPWS